MAAALLGERARRGHAGPAATPTTASAATIRTYPPGHWRALDRSVLGNVVLWVSHILIRHAGSASNVSFAPEQWQGGPLPDRSRQAALAIAERVAAEASADDFARLAALHSEDIPTRLSGGSLGGISAVELAADPEVLDALESTPAGAVSRVVESRYGFHVLLRRPPPEEATVTGAHIVIGHDEARWLHEHVARRPVPARSRAAASIAAGALHEELHAEPERFDELLAEASEHRDAAWGGDLGTWSTRERAPFPRQIERLAQLEVGAVAPPIEPLFGYEILVRRPNLPRQQLAMHAVRLRYDRGAPAGHAASRASVELDALALARRAVESPSELDGHAGRCCPVQARWEEGRAYGGLTPVLVQLAIGQVSAQPVEWESSFYVLRRIAPEALLARPAVLLDFPSRQ